MCRVGSNWFYRRSRLLNQLGPGPGLLIEGEGESRRCPAKTVFQCNYRGISKSFLHHSQSGVPNPTAVVHFPFRKMVDFSRIPNIFWDKITFPRVLNWPLAQVVGPKCPQGLGHPSRGEHCTEPLGSGWFGWRWKIYRSEALKIQDFHGWVNRVWIDELVPASRWVFVNSKFCRSEERSKLWVKSSTFPKQNYQPFHTEVYSPRSHGHLMRSSPWVISSVIPRSPELPRWKLWIPKWRCRDAFCFKFSDKKVEIIFLWKDLFVLVMVMNLYQLLHFFSPNLLNIHQEICWEPRWWSQEECSMASRAINDSIVVTLAYPDLLATGPLLRMKETGMAGIVAHIFLKTHLEPCVSSPKLT